MKLSIVLFGGKGKPVLVLILHCKVSRAVYLGLGDDTGEMGSELLYASQMNCRYKYTT
jgi:hypothetical protein